ncbi:MAG: anthranilate synthase component I family protein [Planctomycetes bacterium]|nr:anthranilate synthase component I family protein [Planctomycetota bacterium]
MARALRQAGAPGVSVLESGLDQDDLGRSSFVCLRPLALARAAPGGDLEVVDGPRGLPRRLPGDPLAAARDLLRRLRPSGARRPPAPFPFAGGALLALSYDLGRRYERLPGGPPVEPGLPDLWVAVHDGALAFDHRGGRARWVGAPGRGRDDALAALRAAAPLDLPAAPRPAAARPSLDTAAYRRAVRTARAWIRRGDLFEVNLSRRWEAPPVDPDRCLAALRALSPAPFMADLELAPGVRLLSASPERFLSLDARGRATSWPIKGTRRRGLTPAEDRALLADLLASDKERAELAMIVDLVRNDLGRVARPGSVRVVDARRAQSWPQVHHTVAVVEGHLDQGRDWADLVSAAFPPGSVTGAPKVRAMEVIDALEPVRRGPYCGAFGWVGWDGALDLAVAIRIVVATPTRTLVHAGGAVLLGSDPAAEEREGRLKARAGLRAVAAAAAGGG